jgi:hypothetical protein
LEYSLSKKNRWTNIKIRSNKYEIWSCDWQTKWK